MGALFILRLTLRSGKEVELGFRTAEAAVAARQKVVPTSEILGDVADDFGHVFSRPVDGVESCLFVDYAAERQFMLMAATMQAEAQAAFNHEMQRRQAAAGKLLIPAGAAMPQPGMNGGSRA